MPALFSPKPFPATGAALPRIELRWLMPSSKSVLRMSSLDKSSNEAASSGWSPYLSLARRIEAASCPGSPDR